MTSSYILQNLTVGPVVLIFAFKPINQRKTLNHLEIDGTCDPFVSISYFDELYSTKHRTGTLDAEYGDTFDIFVHSAERTLALSAEAHSVGPAVKCECWDWNRTLGSKLIGTKEITLSELFSSPFPVEHTLQIFDTDGFPVKGAGPAVLL